MKERKIIMQGDKFLLATLDDVVMEDGKVSQAYVTKPIPEYISRRIPGFVETEIAKAHRRQIKETLKRNGV